MSLPATVYRDQIIRAVLGCRPAMLAHEADPTALERICEHLAQCEAAHDILRQKGWGKAGTSIADVARTVPEAPKAR
jgi:hypothetical protein